MELTQENMSLTNESFEKLMRPHFDEMGRAFADMVESYIEKNHPEIVNSDKEDWE